MGSQITLPTAGTYLIFARLKVEVEAATYAANRNITAKLARVNNTPADLVQTNLVLDTMTVRTFSLPIVFQVLSYTTATTGDVIKIQAEVDAIPDNSPTGRLYTIENNLVALKLF